MQTIEQVMRRPFHETVVGAIHRASGSDLDCLATLIKETVIPKGHDEIIAALKQHRGELWQFAHYVGPDIRVIVQNLLEQKQEAAANEEAKKQTTAVSS